MRERNMSVIKLEFYFTRTETQNLDGKLDGKPKRKKKKKKKKKKTSTRRSKIRRQMKNAGIFWD